MRWRLAITAFLLVGHYAPRTDLEAARDAMEARDWRQAVSILSRHLDHEPEHLEAMYLRGICYGEIGKNPNLRNRLEQALQKGVADFEKVLAQDSLYRDTVFQYALIRRYENNFQEAIRLGEEQIRLKPELAHVHIGLLNFYWRYVVSTPSLEARLWLREQPGKYAELFVGKTYEQQSLFSPAMKIYARLQAENGRSVPLLLALARLHFARQEPISGTRYVKQSIEAIRSDLDARLVFDEIRTIVSPGEQAAFERLDSPAETQRFFTEFWAKRDPMPAAPYNARLVEHYRRLQVAETHYVFNGFRNWFRSRYTHDERYFPPTYILGQDFDDRGIMFLRHGEPDDFTVGESPSWLYESSEEQNDSVLVFHFAATCHNGVCGVTKHFVPVPRGESLLPPKLTGLDRLDAERKTREYITMGLTTDRHRWPTGTKVLDVPYMFASFRGLDQQTLVEVYFDVPLAQLTTEADTVTFEAGFMVHDEQWGPYSFSRNTTKLPRDSEGGPHIGLFQVDLPARPFHMALHVRSLDQPALRAHRTVYQPLSFLGAGVKLSDILLADTVVAFEEGEISAREDVHVKVNPAGYFKEGVVPYVYFEVYDLTLNPEGRSRYTVSYSLSGEHGDVISVAPKEQQGRLGSPIEFVGIDVSDASRGTYVLTVAVEDHISGATAARSRTLIIGR